MAYFNNKKIFFLLFALIFILHLSWVVFTNDLKLYAGAILLDFVLIILFSVSLAKLEYGFFLSLLLLPFFFLLENISILDRIYQGQSSALSLYSLDPRIIGFTLASLFTILMIIKKKKKGVSVPLSKILPPVIIYFSLSALWAVQGSNNLLQVSFYILLSSLFFLSYFSAKNITSFYKLLSFLILLSLPALLLSYYQLFSGLFYEYSDMDIKRISGPFDSPNLLGSLILLTSALAFILILIHKSNIFLKKQHSLLIIYLLVALPILFMTFSRSAWLGLLIFLGIFSLRKRALFIGVIFSSLLLIFSMFFFESTKARINGFTERRMFDSMYARTNIWYLSHRKFIEKPIFGYGAGSFATVINDAKESNNGTENPHNDLVFFAVEGGLIGLGGFLLIISCFYFYLFKYHRIIIKKKQKIPYALLSWGIISLFISFSIISMVESYYEGNFFHLFTWTILGSWLGTAQVITKNTKPAQQ